jgi:splicing factor 3B subunit 3
MHRDHSLHFIAYSSLNTKSKFFLIQSEFGDVYKVNLEWDKEGASQIICTYFDTLLPASSLNILKSGYVFAASEFGNHFVYSFLNVDGSPDDVKTTSLQAESSSLSTFNPRSLKNFAVKDEIENYGTITDFICEDVLREGNP